MKNAIKRSLKVNYGEGDWFAVPLQSGGFALGLIARAPKVKRSLFGYFFGPRLRQIPSIDYVERLSAGDAVWVIKFGDYSLFRGEWPVLGAQGCWNRADWPMPSFSRIDEKGRAVIVEYSEDDPSVCIRETPCSVEEAKKCPEDGMFGSHLVVSRLSKLIPI